MRIERDIEGRIARLAQCPRILRAGTDNLAPAVRVHIDPVWAELEGIEAPILVEHSHRLSGRGNVGRCVDTRIDFDPIACVANEQHVNRYVQRFG